MIVDLRSDVLTKPTPEMLFAMTSATFGDDVFGEEETVNKLQVKTAALTGKESALFVASGTMANQLAIASLTSPHDEVVLDINSHIFQFEQGAPAVISGVQLRPMAFTDGLIDTKELAGAVRFADIHHPRSRLLCLEITHNYNGGSVPNFRELQVVVETAQKCGLKVHIDGARIWNAVVATGIPIKEYASLCDTMMFCLSKGLGAPIGSILVGRKETIERARYLRKGLGGGWRKPGMLAAAGLYALENNIKRLSEDHRRAKVLADAVKKNGALELLRDAQTNMVFFRPKNGNLAAYSEKLTSKGILHDWQHFNAVRLVTHLGVTDEMIAYTVDNL